MSEPGPDNFLPETIYNGQLGHATKHNETNDQINWLTEQVGGRLSEDELSTAIADGAAGYLASEPGVVAAAATAAEDAVDDALDTSSRIPVERDDDTTGRALSWVAEVGRRDLGGVTQDGYVEPVRGVRFDGTDLEPVTDTRYTRGTLLPTTGLAHYRLGEDALDAEGNVTDDVLERLAARMPGVNSPTGRGIVCVGDSLTAGAYGSGTSYPQHLSTLAPGVPVAKRGAPGEKSKEISMRQGATPLVTTGAVTIPASGGVTVSMNTTAMFTNANATNGIPDGIAMVGSLNGVKGTLTITGGVFTFTRTSSGDAYAVPVGTPWLDDFASTHRDWNHVFWPGRNNVNATPSDVATYNAAMVANKTGGDYIVMAVTNGTAEPSGHANYTAILGINAALAAAHGAHYFDVRSWLIAHGCAAVGITPDATDLTAISQDRIPPSLLAADGIHFNADGYKAIAIGVHEFATGRNWF